MAAALARYGAAAAAACGPNTAHDFPPHITLTGFFHDTSPDWPAYGAAVAAAIESAGPPPDPPARVTGLLVREDFHGLTVESPWLRAVAARFAEAAPAATRTDGIRLKEWLHISLAYGFDRAAGATLGALAGEWVDPATPATWQVRLYERTGDAEWIVRESLDVGTRQV